MAATFGRLVRRREAIARKAKVVLDIRTEIESSTSYDEVTRDEVLADIDAYLIARYNMDLERIDSTEVKANGTEDEERDREEEARPVASKSQRPARESAKRRARTKAGRDGEGGGSPLQ